MFAAKASKAVFDARKQRAPTLTVRARMRADSAHRPIGPPPMWAVAPSARRRSSALSGSSAGFPSDKSPGGRRRSSATPLHPPPSNMPPVRMRSSVFSFYDSDDPGRRSSQAMPPSNPRLSSQSSSFFRPTFADGPPEVFDVRRGSRRPSFAPLPWNQATGYAPGRGRQFRPPPDPSDPRARSAAAEKPRSPAKLPLAELERARGGSASSSSSCSGSKKRSLALSTGASLSFVEEENDEQGDSPRGSPDHTHTMEDAPRAARKRSIVDITGPPAASAASANVNEVAAFFSPPPPTERPPNFWQKVASALQFHRDNGGAIREEMRGAEKRQLAEWRELQAKNERIEKLAASSED
ncbi:hypothetical protein TeGR_g5976, partial [Tetraparma gracilis]